MPTTKKTKKKPTTIKNSYTKIQIQQEIAEEHELSRKQVAGIFDSLGEIIERHIGKKGSAGEFTLPGLLKIKITKKPATKERKGINPFTGEEAIFQAKPAKNVVKIKPLKKLKDMVE